MRDIAFPVRRPVCHVSPDHRRRPRRGRQSRGAIPQGRACRRLAPTARRGWRRALDGQYDELIVDRMLPKLDGLVVIGTMRGKGNRDAGPILSRARPGRRPGQGLRAGGDDYLPEPYRVRRAARARRGAGASGGAVRKRSRVGDLELDLCRHQTRAARRSSCSRANSACSNISCAMPDRWSSARCCSRTCGSITSIRRPTSSTCTSRGCAPRSIRASPRPLLHTVRGAGYVIRDSKVTAVTRLRGGRMTFIGAGDGARQGSPHDGVQADAVYLDDFCAVCRVPARLFRLEHAPLSPSRSPRRRRRDHRSGGAIRQGGIRRLVFVVDARSRRPSSLIC